MFTVLYWNLNRKPLGNLFGRIASSVSANVVVAAEPPDDEVGFLTELNAKVRPVFRTTLGFSKRLRTYTRFPRNFADAISDDNHVSIRHLRPPALKSILLVGVHLPSKLHTDDQDQTMRAQRLMGTILEAEQKVDHTRTVIIGDLNMDPFDAGVVNADCLHAVMDRRVAAAETRKVGGIERRYFYNPMWSLLGDESFGPPGTYFHNRGGQYNLFWHTFDQVLVRPSLLDSFSPDSVRVISEVAGTSLLGSSGRPDDVIGSDHLPIVASFQL